jgi:hypothetical protein
MTHRFIGVGRRFRGVPMLVVGHVRPIVHAHPGPVLGRLQAEQTDIIWLGILSYSTVQNRGRPFDGLCSFKIYYNAR